MVVKPFALDTQTTTAVADEMLEGGRKIAIEHAQSFECKDFTCATVKTAALISLQNNDVKRITNLADPAPTPPARPDWAN